METYKNLDTVMAAATIPKNRARFKKLVVFCTFCFLSATCLFAGNTVTRYYKQIKIVTKDKKEQTGNSSGQFITFNDNGCYDSDKSGYTVNNGFLKFGKSTSERVYYSGSSYWGQAMYIFMENYGRLNIVIEDSGVTYVYVLATPPANVFTSALIKVNEKTSTATTTYPPPTTTTTEKTWHNCGCCNGTGNCRNHRCVGGKQQCGTCGGVGRHYNTYTKLYESCANPLCRGGYTNCGSCTNGKCNCCNGKRGEYY